jgi:anti-sigma28 factor (negative regulator of flagellin synthesis)
VIIRGPRQGYRERKVRVDTKIIDWSQKSIGVAMESPAETSCRRWHPGLPQESSMNPVNNASQSTPVQKILTNPISKSIPANAPAQLPAADKLELSGVSHLLSKLKTNDIRTDKVASVRAQIEAGTYETEDKLDAATDRLLDDLSK